MIISGFINFEHENQDIWINIDHITGLREIAGTMLIERKGFLKDYHTSLTKRQLAKKINLARSWPPKRERRKLFK